MGNTGSNKIHKADSERLGDYHHPSLQRGNPKHYNGGFKVLPERIPNQRLRPTDNGHLLQNGGTLSGRRPTSISGIPDSTSSPQPPPLPPPLTEEELTHLLKKRQYHHPMQFQRHSIAESRGHDNSFGPAAPYIPDSTKSDIDFRVPRPAAQFAEASKKKYLFSRKSKAEAANAINVDDRFKKSNKKDFLNKHSNSSNTGPESDRMSTILIPPPSQFGNTDVNTPVKIDSKDKKSIKYVFERQETSGDQRLAAGERHHRFIKRENSPSDNKYNAGGRTNNHHPIIHGQLSDGSLMHASTMDRSDLRHAINESLQKRVRSMDSLVHNDIDDNPQGESPNVTKRSEIEERISKMSKQFNQSMDNIYLLSKTNNDIMLMRKPSDVGAMNKIKVPDGPKWSNNSKSNHGIAHKSELNLRSNYYADNPDIKANNDDDVFDPPDIEFNYNKNDQNKPYLKPKDSRNLLNSVNRQSDSAEIVSEHAQEAFFAKTRETRSGVLEFNRRLGKNQSKKDASRSATNEHDESSEDDMDIDMQLRPTLPKRHLAVPRFSPTHVWRSLSVEMEGRRHNGGDDRLSIHSSDAEEEGDVYEDRIHRVARPMAPPRISNEKSADSGISPGAVSPLPQAATYDFHDINEKSRPTTNKTNTASSSPSSNNNTGSTKPPAAARTSSSSLTTQNNPALGGVSNVKDRFTLASQQQREAMLDKNNAIWTPEEDLASDFDAGSGEIPIVSVEARQFSSWGPEFVSSHPKLTSRKNMFSSKPMTSNDEQLKNTSNGQNDDMVASPSGAPQTFNSVRKLKRSLSGVLQNNAKNKSAEPTVQTKYTNLDENWSLSRSLPNSLHNGHENEKLTEYRASNSGESAKNSPNKKIVPQKNSSNVEKKGMGNAYFQPKLNRSESGPVYFGDVELSHLNADDGDHFIPFTDLEGHKFNNSRATSGNPTASSGKHRLMYLPTYEAMQIIDEKANDNQERKAYSDLGTRTETNIPLAARSSSTLTSKETKSQNKKNYQGKTKKGKKFTYQSTVRQNERKQLEQKLSKEVALEEKRRAEEIALVNKVEEEFQKKRDREKVDIKQQLRILNLKDEDDDDNEDDSDTENDETFSPEHHHSLPWDHSHHHLPHNYNGPPSLPLHIPPIDYDISKPNPSHNPTYRDSTPYKDSTPSSTGLFGGISKWMKKPTHTKTENGQRNDRLSRLEPEGAPSTLTMQDGNNRQPSPQQESRGRAISGSKFSSGRSPDIAATNAPRKSIYTHLAQVAEKEKQFEKQASDSRTSVWISPDKTYPTQPSSSKLTVGSPLTTNNRSNSYHQLSYNNSEQLHDYYPNGHSSMPYDISNDSNKSIDKDHRNFHGGMLQPQDWKSQGNQRHSIAIDTSSSSSRGGSGGPWAADGFRNPDGSSNTSNERIKSPKTMPSTINYNIEYNHSNQGNSSDYRKRQNSPGLNSNHRSLSFTHIPAINYEGQSRSPRVMVPTLVQPYNATKAYRPVPFYSKK